MKKIRLWILCAVAVLAVGLTTFLVLASDNKQHSDAGHHKKDKSDDHDSKNRSDDHRAPRNATVSFGGWMTSPPLDRFPNLSPREANHHELIPQVAKIKAGGTVNFIIGGFHLVLVYDNGTKPEDINTTATIPPTNPPGALGPPLINDPNRRIYRGLDPSTQSQDRVEVVHFAEPGKYLVICGVLPHFQEGMYGYVRVVR